MPWLLDGTQTELQTAEHFRVTPEQVAAVRAYVFANFEAVMAKHAEFEARAAAGNSPEVLAKIAGGSPAWRQALARAGRYDLLRESTPTGAVS